MKDITVFSSKLPSTVQYKQVTLDLTKYMEVADGLVEQAERAKITDAETYAKGGDLISIARAQSKKAEDDRLALTKPINALLKFINAGYKLPKDRFTDVRSSIEVKMMKWKRAEDERLREEAKEERKKLEAEALERAVLEKSEEAQDEVLDAAQEAGEELIEGAGVKLQRGDFGSSTGTKKTYHTEVHNVKEFLGALLANIENGNKREIDLGSMIEFRKLGMNKFAERLYKAGVRQMPGAKFIESENIRVY
jgi:hypothetical protein